MKSVILSTECDSGGGAGRAALRLHRALRQVGAENDMFVKYRVKEASVLQFDDPKIHNRLIDHFVNQEFHKTIKHGNTMSSLPYPYIGLDFLEELKLYDIINLHWITNFISIEAVSAMDKPLVWTLHDQNPFTGGCHYTHGCEKYMDSCDNCPQINENSLNYTRLTLAAKHTYYPKDIVIVTPSKWLADCAKQSSLFKHNRIEVIPNSVETDAYKPYDKAYARRSLDLPEDGKIIMLGAFDLNERRKGVRHFVEAFQKMAMNDEVSKLMAENKLTILTYGKGASMLEGFDHICRSMGFVEDENVLARMYSAADVFVLPSEEDNLPNTMLESFACGTPVVSFRVGGMMDTIVDGQTGYLAEPFDTSMLADCIQKTLFNNHMSELCRKYAIEHFRPEIQASRYEQLFADVLESYRNVNRTNITMPSLELSQFLTDYTYHMIVRQQNECIEQISALQTQNNQLNAQCTELQIQINQWQAHCNALENSTSWKITKPLRRLSSRIKQLKGS